MFSNIKYTWDHKIAYLKVEKELTGKNTLYGYLHDADKLFLYLVVPKKIVSKIHRLWSKHHVESFWKNKDYNAMVIDWESARYTKFDKLLNARETLDKWYPELRDKIEPILKEMSL